MQLARFPRLTLAHLPTPLEPMERLTAHLGEPRLLVKRDDCTGLALGGNKTRKLEFLMAEAQAQGADCIITTGGVQSNHVRQTAAAAARLGFDCHLVLGRTVPWNDPDYEATGNVQLDRLLGAELHLVAGDTDRNAAMAALADELSAAGRKPYVIPSGGSNAVGALGYVGCALELEEQANRQGLVIDYLMHATGSAGTQAVLIAGFHAVNSRTRVLGIDIDAEPEAVASKIRHIAGKTAASMDLAPPDDAATVVESGYAGAAYGLPTPEMAEAVRLAARLEGLVLDPVYTGKAMAGLIGLVRQGRFKSTDTVVFLHTGGAPGLFAYRSVFEG